MKRQSVFDNFASGVITTMRADALPNSASPYGRNSILAFLANGQAVAAKRPGFLILNTAPVSGRPTLIGQIEFNRHVAGVLTSTHCIVGSDGSLNKLVGSTISPLDAGHPTPFTAGNLFPVFAVLNDLLFVVNGTDAKKASSTGAVQNFGIAAPTAAPTLAVGAAGTPNGSYDIALTYYNQNTGNESSRGPYNTIAVTNQQFTVSWTAPTDTQCTHVFVYIRKQSLNSQFFRLIVGTTPASDATGGFPVATTSITVNVSDASITALTLLAPTLTENSPPPTGVLAVAAHLSRMWVADTGYLYYSKPRLPEDFDPTNARVPVNPNDGQNIVAIGSYFDKLLIWKTGAFYALYGSDENSWYVDVVDPTIGATSAQSIVYFEGYLYWWSKQGPVRWNGYGPPQKIGQMYLAPTISRDAINFGALNQIVAGVDEDSHSVLFAVPEDGQTRNTLVLPCTPKARHGLRMAGTPSTSHHSQR